MYYNFETNRIISKATPTATINFTRDIIKLKKQNKKQKESYEKPKKHRHNENQKSEKGVR